jgi:cytochrome c553
MNKIVANLVVAAGVLAVSMIPSHATGDDAAAGKEKKSMCAGCHGIPDWRTAYPTVYSVPKLGGQHADYIVKALQAYKSGARNHPTMQAIAASLSDEDMANLAAYYTSTENK